MRGLLRVDYVESVRRADDREAYVVSRYYGTPDNKQQDQLVPVTDVQHAMKYYADKTSTEIAKILTRDKIEEKEREAGLRT